MSGLWGTARALRRGLRSKATRHPFCAREIDSACLSGPIFCAFAPFPAEGLYGQPLEHRLAPIVDAGRARLRAGGEGVKQIAQLAAEQAGRAGVRRAFANSRAARGTTRQVMVAAAGRSVTKGRVRSTTLSCVGPAVRHPPRRTRSSFPRRDKAFSRANLPRRPQKAEEWPT
jgi:hypothetical protein